MKPSCHTKMLFKPTKKQFRFVFDIKLNYVLFGVNIKTNTSGGVHH